ncbi:phage tail tip lysozyme [Novosphingobium rosa]|uniref:phage tail tip lysozyme n=1 Tax=Novosphingobium rosa TaxID=76978 RepID=UPI000A88A05A|nr:phage tail tip lysozyme [Novosphingobium rosa]
MPNFIRLAPAIMGDLIIAFELTPVQAAAIVGNLGTESANFTAYHERGQAENKGGYGWAQWTGPRRKTFFAWADAHHLQRDSEAASLGYLEHELNTSYRRSITTLKKQSDLNKATHAFMISFEGPGIPNEADRQNHARIALAEYNRLHPVGSH